ncbi:MAG: DUF1294 domain-containing protein [Clostridia bacterium]|nr:DUF1294 domain-containing protein [Clostridia bacterium]
MTILWIVWACLNVFTFLLYGLDKLKAKRNKWRIPEKTLLLFTWLMGGVGAFAGMQVFRHKTKHIAFQLSAPVGAVLSLAVMFALTYMMAA